MTKYIKSLLDNAMFDKLEILQVIFTGHFFKKMHLCATTASFFHLPTESEDALLEQFSLKAMPAAAPLQCRLKVRKSGGAQKIVGLSKEKGLF